MFLNQRREAAGLLPAPPSDWFDRVLKKRIVVHLKTDQSIEGLLMELMPDGVLLRAAKLLGDGDIQADTPIAGETFIERKDIAFTQFDG